MKRLKYELTGGFDEKDLKSMHDQVLMVLDQVGIECPHERSLNRLKGEKGIAVEGSRVRFKPGLVNACMDRYRTGGGPAELPDEITLSGPWNCFNIEDLETGEVRRSTAADVKEMFKLLGALQGGPVSPVYPTDVEGPLQLLFLEKAGIELTGSDGSRMEYTDDVLRELAIEMYRVAGRRYHLMVEFPISPLRINPLALDTIWKYAGREDIDLYAASAPIPQAGATAPLSPLAGFVQSVAETYAGCIVIDKITDGKTPVRPEFRLELTDFRHMTVAYGAPEEVLHQIAVRQVYRYFTGRPKIEHILQCNAKRCDLQAMMERTAWMTTHVLAGYRHFMYAGGQLSMDEVFSPAQYMIDLEIARYLTHLVRGVEFDENPAAAFETIKGVGPGGNYLDHDTTVDAFRKYYQPELFPRTNVDQWRAAGEPDLWRRAAAKARALIDGYAFSIDPGVQKELDRIYEKARRHVGL